MLQTGMTPAVLQLSENSNALKYANQDRSIQTMSFFLLLLFFFFFWGGVTTSYSQVYCMVAS